MGAALLHCAPNGQGGDQSADQLGSLFTSKLLSWDEVFPKWILQVFLFFVEMPAWLERVGNSSEEVGICERLGRVVGFEFASTCLQLQTWWGPSFVGGGCLVSPELSGVPLFSSWLLLQNAGGHFPLQAR